MTHDEIRAVIGASPELQALAPDTQALAAHPIFANHKQASEYWLTDRGLVSDLTVATGSPAMSDSILTKFDTAAGQSRSVKAVSNRLYSDDRGINFGDPAMVAWFVAMTPALFTEQERDALLALSQRPAPVGEFEIRQAIFNDNGSLRV